VAYAQQIKVAYAQQIKVACDFHVTSHTV